MLTNKNFNFNPIVTVPTFMPVNLRSPFFHPAMSLLTDTVASYKESLKAFSQKYKIVMGDLSLFLNQTLRLNKTPEYTMHDREALMFLGDTRY